MHGGNHDTGRRRPDAAGPAAAGPAAHPAGGASRSLVAVALAALAIWLWVTVPLATGQRTLFFRDVLGNHFALKAFGAQQLAAGEVPAFNPTLGMGQPFRGNPSALAFYPGNALYLLPFWSAFNLHYALHWLLALVAMALLARRLGLGSPAALLAGITYAGSGWLLSTLSFYNLVTVAAWWPLAMAGAATGGRRALALGGAACGMALLGGEPLTAALGLVPLVAVAVERRGWRRGLLRSFGVGALGLLVAAPQVVATLRILGFSFRGSQGVGELASQFTLPPLRLLELLLPLPFGWPMDIGPRGWWLGRTAPDLGYYLSLYAGIVALWLALRAARRHPGLALVATAGVAGAMVLGGAPELVRSLTGGLFRYPEKLLVWYALALPLLAARGLEEALGGEAGAPRRYRGAMFSGALLAAGALAVLALRPGWIAAAPLPELIAAQTRAWGLYLALGGGLLVAGAVALRHRAAAVVVALQLAALVQLHPLVRTLPTEPLRSPAPWVAVLEGELPGPPWAVVNTRIPRPAWGPAPDYAMPQEGNRGINDLRNALDLYPGPGVAHGLTYPLAPDIEGMSSPLYTFLSVEVARLGWPGRLAWLRATGVEAVVATAPLPPSLVEQPAPAATPGGGPRPLRLRVLDRQVRAGVATTLYAAPAPAPEAWWPRRVTAAPGPRAALTAVAALPDPVATVVAARPVEHDPGGRVAIVARSADRLELEVASDGGGLVVVRRSFHPLYRVRAADGDGRRELAVQPVQLTLLGIEVPAGRHRVVVDVDDRPVAAAAALSLLTLLALLAVVLRGGRRRGVAGAGEAGKDGEDGEDGG